jgi:diadenosine tetraphosphate (Ap4A) HIT family hydrolase
VTERKWDQWAEGVNCPFDRPRAASNEHWDFIAQLPASSLYLQKNQAYLGHCILIWDAHHAARIDQLTSEQWLMFCADLYRVESAVMRALAPDHINVEILGNAVPHLHWQVIPRYRNDPRWEAPIWTTTIEEAPVLRLPEPERIGLIEKLQIELGVVGNLN